MCGNMTLCCTGKMVKCSFFLCFPHVEDGLWQFDGQKREGWIIHIMLRESGLLWSGVLCYRILATDMKRALQGWRYKAL